MSALEFATPQKAAFTVTRWLDAAFGVDGKDRFPVDVKALALSIGQQMKDADRIVEVQALAAPTFEGGLFELSVGKWALIYNDAHTSPRRSRWTQAHELGHFLVHRALRKSFECSAGEAAGWNAGDRDIEREADEFASNLLLPRKQFDQKLAGQPIDFDSLSGVADFFEVSLTATALRCVRLTDESLVLISSRDGFIDWSVASDRARRNGAFYRTVGTSPIELPFGSVAADSSQRALREGEKIPLRIWFEHAHRDAFVKEMKLQCDSYGNALTLLHLSPRDLAWPPWSN